jgi:hypothetical protein
VFPNGTFVDLKSKTGTAGANWEFASPEAINDLGWYIRMGGRVS